MADGALEYAFTTLHAGGVVAARHVQRILLVLTADDALRTLLRLLLVGLNLRAVHLHPEGRHRTDLEAVLVLEYEFKALCSLLRQSPPCALN